MEGEDRLRLSQTQLANNLTAQVKSVDMVSSHWTGSDV